MPPRNRAATNAAKPVDVFRDNDVPLAKLSDEVRQFFRFERPGAPQERRVTYPVHAYVPSSSSSSSSSSAPSASVSSILPVDALAAPVDAILPEATALLEEIRRKYLNSSSSDAAAAAAAAAGEEGKNKRKQKRGKRKHDGRNKDDDDNGDESSDEGTRDNKGNDDRAAASSSSSLAKNVSEAIPLVQNSGTFVFSRRNSVREFRIVGNVGAADSAGNGAGGGAPGGTGARTPVQRSGSLTSSGGRVLGAASHNNNIINNNIDLSTVTKMCLTLPIRTHTARVARMVHEIALLLAMAELEDF